MTTNDMSVIDPALLRPGRIDRIEHVGYLTTEQAAQILKRFYGASADAEIPEFTLPSNYSPSDLIEVIKRNWRANAVTGGAA